LSCLPNIDVKVKTEYRYENLKVHFKF